MKVEMRTVSSEHAMQSAGLPHGKFEIPSSIEILAQATDGHNNFLKGIIVEGLIECSQVMLLQLERYHFFTIISCESKMHMMMKEKLNSYNSLVLQETKDIVNKCIEAGDFERAVYNCPMGMNLTLGFTTNYMCLKNIYKQRKSHKLKEWRDFCREIAKLPNMNRWLP